MTIENKIKELILARYGSLREFTIAIDMSYSTLHSILTRGVNNSSIGNVANICKTLGISVDGVAEGKIIPNDSYKFSDSESTDLDTIVSNTKAQLSYDGVTVNGETLDDDTKHSIIGALEVAVELSKRKKK